MEFIISKDEYIKVKAAWAKMANRDATDHIFYNALRGHDLNRGFSETTCERKLSNGAKPWEGFNSAKSNASWRIRISPTYTHDSPEKAAKRIEETKERINQLSASFGIEFSEELIKVLRELLK